MLIRPESGAPIPDHLSRGEVLGIVRVAAAPENSKPSFPRSLDAAVASEIERHARRGNANSPVDIGTDETEVDLSTGGR